MMTKTINKDEAKKHVKSTVFPQDTTNITIYLIITI